MNYYLKEGFRLYNYLKDRKEIKHIEFNGFENESKLNAYLNRTKLFLDVIHEVIEEGKFYFVSFDDKGIFCFLGDKIVLPKIVIICLNLKRHFGDEVLLN